MLIIINHRAYLNKNIRINESKYNSRNENKYKENLNDSEIENKNPNNTIIPMKRRIGDKENDNILNINQIEKKEKNDNVEYIKKEIKTKSQIKIKNIIKENISIKKVLKNNENKEFIVDDEKLKVNYFNISNIDNNQIPKDYINIIYYNLLKEEELGINPMPDYTYMIRQNEINDKMRSILVDWIIEVHFKFNFTDETLFMTILIIDRYLSVCKITRSKFQLLGITALMIACKHEEIDLPKIKDFIYITDNAYTKNEVIKMEEEILDKLNFAFVYPSPIKFFEYLSLHFNFSKKHHMMGKYLMESFLLDIKNIKYKPSIISCACAYIVMKFFKMKNYQESYDKKFFVLDETVERYSEYNIKECAKDICILVDNISKSKYKSCFKKYSKPENEKVSVLIMNN